MTKGALLAVAAATTLAACASAPQSSACRSAAQETVIASGDARIALRTVGAGAPVLVIPSLGRGVGDFDALAAALARDGHLVILPEPRGIGASTGPAPRTLADLADDAAAAIAHVCDGPVDVVGHAFGQRVARQLAVQHPGRVRRIVLLAAGGRVDMPADVRRDIGISAGEGEYPDEERLRALRHVFFAPGNDARAWLTGWHPAAARAQTAATQATPVDAWWGAGAAEMLVVQPLADPIAPPANSAALVEQYGDRVRVVNLAHASHAVLPEQPEAVAAVIGAFLDGTRDAGALQRLVDARVRTPEPLR